MLKDKLKLLIPIFIVLLFFSVIVGRGFLINSVGNPTENNTNKEYAMQNSDSVVTIPGNKSIVVDNVDALRKANLDVGMTAVTKGYYQYNDGGTGFYNIKRNIGSDTDNGGNIIILDNGNVAELITDGTVTPSLFGAVCNKNKDDSTALQNCINYAASKYATVIIDKDIFINRPITVPSRVNIRGKIYNEYYPCIIAGANCAKVFDCIGVQNSFRDLQIKNYQRNYRAYVGFDLHGNKNYDIDTDVINCYVAYAEKGAIVRGRNVKFLNDGFSHCKYGIYYDFPSGTGASQFRGCEINGTRFHGIGEESALKFVDCAAIYINNGISVNLTVLNCTADQGGTFIVAKPNSIEMLISNNFVESFEGPIIDLGYTGDSHVSRNCVLTNNIFKGKRGNTSYGRIAGYPDTLVSIKNWEKIIFANNAVSFSEYRAVALDTVSKSIFENNSFLNIGRYARDERAAFNVKNCHDIAIKNNVLTNETLGTAMVCKGDKNNPSSVSLVGNIGFSNSSDVTVNNGTRFITMYSGTFGKETHLVLSDLPNGNFMIRRTDGSSAWMCIKQDSYIAFSSLMKNDTTAVDYITYRKDENTGKLTFFLKRLALTTNIISDINQAYVIQIPY